MPRQPSDEIRDRLSIVSFIGERIPLKKGGRNFKGLCPFHQEKTPSFMVSDEKQIFHCFGCGVGGDIFTFFMKFEGLSFQEALKTLADKAGVKLPSQSPKEKGAREEQKRREEWGFRLNTLAHQFFVQTLNSPIGSKALQYLKQRGFDKKTIETYSLGAAPSQWEDLSKSLTLSKAPLTLAAELGLIKKRENGEGYFDFFRDRVIFPIFNPQGKIVGFGGRLLEKTEEGAKYLNSQDSYLYNKSKTVYGLNWATDAIRKEDEVLLVEGYTDVLSLRQAGISNVVAPLGTALTREHLNLLKRYTKNFVVCFDGDSAGTQAAFRALPLFLELELTPKAIALPNNKDPDQTIREFGLRAFKNLQQNAPTLFEYLIETKRPKKKDMVLTLRAWEELKPLLAKVKKPVEQGLLRKKIAEKLGVEENWLKTQNAPSPLKSPPPSKPLEKIKFPEEERILIAAMLLNPPLIPKVQSSQVNFVNEALKKISTQLFEQYADSRSVSFTSIQEVLDPQLASWIREMALNVEETDWEKAVNDCLTKMKQKTQTLILRSLNEKIAMAEKEGDESELKRLLLQKTEWMKHRGRIHL